MTTTRRLPDIRAVGFAAPWSWLGGGWRDLWRAPTPCLAYGFGVSCLLAGLSYALYASNLSIWAIILTLGVTLIAPLLAMGPYEAGRALEAGERPQLSRMILVRAALRQDAVFLGLALFLIFAFWGQAAQIVYGLSTFQLHETVPAFLQFAVGTPEGRGMIVAGTAVGGAIALVAYTLVVVSAPMLLDRRFDVFMAVATSVRVVARSPGPMLLWAAILAVLALAAAASGFVLMIVVLPWLGLASWRAYRALVVADPPVGA